MKKILFADDDPSIQDVMSLVFADEYEIISDMTGDKVLKSSPLVPDLYLIDKQLGGGLDGLSICRILKSRADTMHVPIIMISASPEIIPEAKKAGADDVICKPFSINDVRTMIRKYIS